MTVTSALAGFAVVAALVTVVPGLDTALVLRTALVRGAGHALAAALGVNTGALAWGVAAAVGVSALLTASETAFTVLRVAGAAYMVWLGLGLLRAALRRGPAATTQRDAWRGGRWAAYRRGLSTNLLNPKVGAFYVAVLPQFVPHEVSPLLMGVLLALVHDALGMAWFGLLIAAAAAMSSVLRRPAVQRGVDAVTGTALVGLGIRLGLSSR
jgi:threonine/homoserine/homoserine lactone efflux protein